MSGRIQVLRWAKIAGYVDLTKEDDGWRLYKRGRSADDKSGWSLSFGPFRTLAAVQEFLKPPRRKAGKATS